MNKIMNYADTVYRAANKLDKLVEKETATIDAIEDHFRGKPFAIIELEKAKSGDMRTMARRISDKINLIHTNASRIFEIIGGNPFVIYDVKDLSDDELPTGKPSQKALETAAKSKNTANVKACDDAAKEHFTAEQWRELKAKYKKVLEIAGKRKYNPVDLGIVDDKKASPFTV